MFLDLCINFGFSNIAFSKIINIFVSIFISTQNCKRLIYLTPKK